VNASALQALDLFLHMQLATFQLDDGEIVDGRMVQSLSDLIFKGSMSSFEFYKVRLDRHQWASIAF
jgi:hypothetical protein